MNCHNIAAALSGIGNQTKQRRRGRPSRIIPTGSFDFSFNSPLWDYAKLAKGSQGYSFRYLWDPVRKKVHSKQEHILVWERVHRKQVPHSYCIHHRDCDPTNNRAENLLCIPVVFHLEIHALLRSAAKKYQGLNLEVERQRIMERFIQQADELEEIWLLVQDEISQNGSTPWA